MGMAYLHLSPCGHRTHRCKGPELHALISKENKINREQDGRKKRQYSVFSWLYLLVLEKPLTTPPEAGFCASQAAVGDTHGEEGPLSRYHLAPKQWLISWRSSMRYTCMLFTRRVRLRSSSDGSHRTHLDLIKSDMTLYLSSMCNEGGPYEKTEVLLEVKWGSRVKSLEMRRETASGASK